MTAQATKMIAQALSNVMAKVSYIQKTGHNKFHGYKYVSESDLLEKLRPAMTEEGLVLIPSYHSSQSDPCGLWTRACRRRHRT